VRLLDDDFIDIVKDARLKRDTLPARLTHPPRGSTTGVTVPGCRASLRGRRGENPNGDLVIMGR
jgi:hypothetical protein